MHIAEPSSLNGCIATDLDSLGVLGFSRVVCPVKTNLAVYTRSNLSAGTLRLHDSGAVYKHIGKVCVYAY